MGIRTSLSLIMLFLIPILFVYSAAADYDGDGIDDSSDPDDDGDGINDEFDACPVGTMSWVSNEESDFDGDGCKDRNVIIDFYDTGDWTYQEFTFSINDGQEFDIYHICEYSCKYETTITLTKPSGESVFWGRHLVDDEMTSTLPEMVKSIGRLSILSGLKGDVAYGDSSIEDSWNEPGTYILNLTDLSESYYEEGYDEDNGGVSIFVYLVGNEDAEDFDDDDDGIVDANDICMFGYTEWTSNSQTDVDNDGCKDQEEDDDDDNDGWPNENDLCTNRRSDSNDGTGTFNYPFTDSWSEQSNNLSDAIPRGNPTFGVIDGDDALYLAGYDSVEFPLVMSEGLNHSDKVQFSMEFNLQDAYFTNNIDTASGSSNSYQGDQGEGARILISNHPYKDDRGLGFSISVELFDEESFGLRLQVTQPPDNHFLHPILTQDLSFGQWYSIRLTYDFTVENPTVEVLLGAERFLFIMTPTIDDIDCWKSHLTESSIYVGSDGDEGVFGPEWEEHNDEGHEVFTVPSVGMFMRNFSSSSPIPEGSQSDVNSGLQALVNHMTGESILDQSGLTQSMEMVMMNLDVPWNSISSNAKLYVDTYSSVEGLIFQPGERWLPSADEPLKYLAFTIQLVIMESAFMPENIAQTEGIQFADAQNFPGLVKADASRVTDGTSLVRGTYVTDPGRSFGGDEKLVQPTGYFAPAGEIVTITIPPENVDGNFVVWVGAHQDDLRYSSQEYARLPMVATSFPIDSSTIQVGNPFGGSIYISTPNGAQEGEISVSISGAVKSPLFSTREISQTTYSQWSTEVNSADAPWVDIMSDRFMTSLPRYMATYSKDTLCTMLDSPDKWDSSSCTFTVPAGKTVTLEPMLHYELNEFSMAITYPDGNTVEYNVESFNEQGSDWQSAPNLVWARESSQSGQYIVELFSESGNGGSSFQAAIMDHDTVFNPSEMLTHWDTSIDAYLVLGGWPLERGYAQQHMWLLPDVQTPVAGTMAPAANPMSMESPVYANAISESYTARDFSWWADPRVVVEADFYDSGINVVWHEWGHLHNIPTLKSEVEAIANLPGAIILNLAFNLSLDESLAYSTFQMMNRSETAIDWMVTSNFRNGERIGEGYKGYTEEGYPLDQVSYQSRGNARYVDIAHMYGWEGLGSIHNVYYQRILNGSSSVADASNPTDSDFIFVSSESLGVNMAPFFDFWGLEVTPNTLEVVNAMPRSGPVKQLLLDYREIIPQNVVQFTEWHESIKSRIGTWQGPQVESYLQTYDDATGQAGLDRIDTLLCLYFATNCENVTEVTPYPDQTYDNTSYTNETTNNNQNNTPQNVDDEVPSDQNINQDDDSDDVVEDNSSNVTEDNSKPEDDDFFKPVFAGVVILVLIVILTLSLMRSKSEY